MTDRSFMARYLQPQNRPTSAANATTGVTGASKQRTSRSAAFLCLIGVALFVSVVTGPHFPMADSAFFEYVGRALFHGHHLYTDLWDNKLPSIYLINALWWLLFGDNYQLHVIAEAIVNLVTIVTFAAIMRKLRVDRWASATLVFSSFYLFVGGPPNQTEHYATPLILIGILFSICGFQIPAAFALIAASTFWIPSIVVGIVPLLWRASARARIVLLGASAGVGLIAVTAFIVYFGVPTSQELVQSWVAYEIGNYQHANYQPEHHSYALPMLSPAYYIQSGLALLLSLIFAFWARTENHTTKFAIYWSAISLVVVFALGKPSPHYFLPVYAPLTMLLALQPLSLALFRRRWYFSGLALVCAALTMYFTVKRIDDTHSQFVTALRYTGELIRDTYGPGIVGMLPWEVYLSSDAVPPGRFYLARVVKYAEEHDRWTEQPRVYVDERDHHLNRLPPPSNLRVMCENDRIRPLVIYSRKAIPGSTCTET
jgi:uncharacterized membrane protein YccF (DUF307 family)